jgi:LysM repeat protein
MSHNLDDLPFTPRLARRFFVRGALRLRRAVATTWPVLMLALLSACGQVVSAKTPTVTPTQEPTPAVLLATIPPRPTVTRAVPTVPPPDTPTPTSPPIVHVVQPGETLIAIALQYGVSVAALQSANGISDPSTLQVSQELVIPTDEESRIENDDLGLLLPTPTPIAFAIEGLICHEEPTGSLWCMGEVANSTEASIENIQLRVTLYNAAGEELVGGDVFTALDLVPSGQRAPFGILFASAPDNYDQFLAVPIRAESSLEPANRYAALQVVADDAAPVGALFQITGTVTNPGQQMVTDITVVVTTYDGDGFVTGFRQAKLPEAIGSGESAGFAISLMPYGGVPANYTVGVQGHLTTP